MPKFGSHQSQISLSSSSSCSSSLSDEKSSLKGSLGLKFQRWREKRNARKEASQQRARSNSEEEMDQGLLDHNSNIAIAMDRNDENHDESETAVHVQKPKRSLKMKQLYSATKQRLRVPTTPRKNQQHQKKKIPGTRALGKMIAPRKRSVTVETSQEDESSLLSDLSHSSHSSQLHQHREEQESGIVQYEEQAEHEEQQEQEQNQEQQQEKEQQQALLKNNTNILPFDPLPAGTKNEVKLKPRRRFSSLSTYMPSVAPTTASFADGFSMTSPMSLKSLNSFTSENSSAGYTTKVMQGHFTRQIAEIRDAIDIAWTDSRNMVRVAVDKSARCLHVAPCANTDALSTNFDCTTWKEASLHEPIRGQTHELNHTFIDTVTSGIDQENMYLDPIILAQRTKTQSFSIVGVARIDDSGDENGTEKDDMLKNGEDPEKPLLQGRQSSEEPEDIFVTKLKKRHRLVQRLPILRRVPHD